MSTTLAYSLPAAAPLYPSPPYAYRDCALLVVPFRAEPGVTRRLVPEPLQPNPDDLMFVAVGLLNNDKLGSTHEAFVGVPSSIGNRTGNFAVFLYLETDACITSGREIWGWPKKQASFRFTADEDRVTATVSRGGELIHAAFGSARPAAEADLELDPTWFNFKLIPSVEEGAPPDVMQLTATTFRDLVVSEARAGAATLRLGGTADDPLDDLIQIRETLPAAFVRFEMDLLHGEVVHDYRAASGIAERPLVAAR